MKDNPALACLHNYKIGFLNSISQASDYSGIYHFAIDGYRT